MKQYTITVNGVAYEVTVEENTGLVSREDNPVVASQPIKASQAQAPTTQKPQVNGMPEPLKQMNATVGNIKIEAPMPGKILSIKGQIGQSVKRGDVVVVLEAMKMENEIVASESGVIASIAVAVGDMVESGTVLVTLN